MSEQSSVTLDLLTEHEKDGIKLHEELAAQRMEWRKRLYELVVGATAAGFKPGEIARALNAGYEETDEGALTMPVLHTAQSVTALRKEAEAIIMGSASWEIERGLRDLGEDEA